MPTKTQEQVVVSQLEKLGFSKAAGELKVLSDRKRKLAIAAEHYRIVRQDKIDAFNAKLKKETIVGKEPYDAKWKTLDFVAVGNYENVPPPEALTKMEEAVAHNCFDNFEVAFIRNVEDPLLFGRINGCPHRFFVAQWDEDCRIEDILLPNEG